MRTIFQDNKSVLVTAPTRAAAYNVGGSKIHKEFKVGVKDVPTENNLGQNARQELMNKLLHTIAIFYERSMISQIVIGTAESNVRAWWWA
jgi:hypothetical protein